MHIHIIGAGMAGVTAAYSLAKDHEVTVYEKEKLPFTFASSRNAAIFRTYEADPTLSALVKRSLFALREIEKITGSLIDSRGLLVDPVETDYYEDNYSPDEISQIQGSPYSYILPDGNSFSGHLLTSNGVIDIHKLQTYLLTQCRAFGVKFEFQCCLSGINKNESVSDSMITELQFDNGKMVILENNSLVINASGSWAADWVRSFGLQAPPLKPYKRHLYFLKPVNSKENPVPDSMPVVWSEKRDIYIRPEAGGYLCSHCDQRPVAADDYVADERETARFLEAAHTNFPFLLNCHISRYWACLRSFTLDTLPLIGYDKLVKNLFWVAGWGGRGMTIASGLIDVIPDLVNNPDRRLPENPFDPARFF